LSERTNGRVLGLGIAFVDKNLLRGSDSRVHS